MIGHLYNVARAVIRDKFKGRSPEWHKVEKAWLALHPLCAACCSTKLVQVHHKTPFHLDPKRELDTTNLISLCMGPLECHLKIGHSGNFKMFDPDVEADAAQCLRFPATRPIVEAKAKANRKAAL